MKMYGRIYLDNGGLHSSIRAMHLQQSNMGIINENITGFNKVGYQKKVPVVSSFTEFIGAHALSSNKDEQVGRIKITKNPLDIALGCKGYFQAQTPNGTKLTRDGRFKLDKNGNLLTLQDFKVLSKDGVPIKFENLPKQVEHIKIDRNGLITYIDSDNLKINEAGIISVVSSDGSFLENVNMKQGYVEESNVVLHEEVYSLINLRRNFSANRQLFMIQNQASSKVMQELGKA